MPTLRIGILGTRGIPNNHGGFEQFAQNLSTYLAKQGCDVYVYNSHKHPFKKTHFNGAKIIRCFDPEYRIGTFGQFVYDFNCIRHARKQNYDVLLQLGYTSSSIWGFLLPRKPKIVTNMDGLEWKRSKYTKKVQRYLKLAEKWAVESSNFLISDSVGIQQYLKKKYDVNSKHIAYGASIFQDENLSVLKKFQLKENKYLLLIARIEPENNIVPVIEGYLQSRVSEKYPLVIIGNCELTRHGRKVLKKYSSHKNIRFLGALYDTTVLNNLRFFSQFYFHGHSVGGTNPSLLEAMASKCLIIAHKNPFNIAVLETEAYYFENKNDITNILDSEKHKTNHPFLELNKLKIQEKYDWVHICFQYLQVFKEILK